MALSGQPMLKTHLTRTTQSGELYRRPPEVEAELHELLRADTVERLARARVTDKESSKYVKNECLVYLIRDAALADDQERYSAFFGILFKRVVKAVERKLLVLGVAEADMHDVHQDVMLAMATAIADGRRGEFYQVRFWAALHRQILKSHDSYRRRKRRSRSELSLDGPAGTGDESDGGEHTLGDYVEGVDDVAGSIEQQMLVSEALAAVTNRKHRAVFVLYHYFGWQIESNDPEERTLSQLYGRTPRMIRNWIRIATRQVGEWRVAKDL